VDVDLPRVLVQDDGDCLQPARWRDLLKQANLLFFMGSNRQC
jgi:hypothetical protein